MRCRFELFDWPTKNYVCDFLLPKTTEIDVLLSARTHGHVMLAYEFRIQFWKIDDLVLRGWVFDDFDGLIWLFSFSFNEKKCVNEFSNSTIVWRKSMWNAPNLLAQGVLFSYQRLQFRVWAVTSCHRNMPISKLYDLLHPNFRFYTYSHTPTK